MKTIKGISQTTGQPFEITETEQADSVSISLTAKGEAQVEVKCYAESAGSAADTAVSVLTSTIAKLREEGIKVVGDQPKA
jgi:hypothetical protein